MSSNNVRLSEKLRQLETEKKSLNAEIAELRLKLKRTEDSLRRYQLIADFAHDWEMWFRTDNSLEYVSPSCQNITGYAAGELINNPSLLNDIIHPSDLNKFQQFIGDSLNFVDIRQSLNFRILTRTKQIRWCEIKCKAVYDSKGKYLGQRASVNDVTRLMQALGEIKNLSEDKENEARIRSRYMREIEDKDRELVSQLLVTSNKNETLQYIKTNLTKHLETCTADERPTFMKMIEHINNTLHATDNWDSFSIHFEKIHPGFFSRIRTSFPSLTNKELKLCSYLRLQLATKEIAGLLNITPQSAEISRVRLRRKLGLKRGDNLVNFILDI